MATPLKPNGSPTSFHVEWTLAQRWIAGILSAFVIAGTLGTLALHVRVAIIEVQVRTQQEVLMQQALHSDLIESRQSAHREDSARHEDAPAKILRIIEVGNTIRKDHEKDMHSEKED